tara:strand:+ start:3564 stop:3821 length:258 start_codon:yes stop_codon:yes gene_type:complete
VTNFPKDNFEDFLPFEGAFTGVMDGGDLFQIYGTVIGVTRFDNHKKICFKVMIKQPTELEGWRADVFHEDFRADSPGMIKLIEPE